MVIDLLAFYLHKVVSLNMQFGLAALNGALKSVFSWLAIFCLTFGIFAVLLESHQLR